MKRRDADRVEGHDHQQTCERARDPAPPCHRVRQRDGRAERRHIAATAAVVDHQRGVRRRAVPEDQRRLKADQRTDDMIGDPRPADQAKQSDVPQDRVGDERPDGRHRETGPGVRFGHRSSRLHSRARKAQSAVASSALIKPITNDKGKAGTGIGGSVIGLVPMLLPGSASPPPDTTALFPSVPVASGATLAVTVMSG